MRGAPGKGLSAAAVVGVVVLVCGGLGVAAGALWPVLAPRATYRVQEGGVALDRLTAGAYVAADGWLAVLCVAAGLGSAVVGWALARGRGALLAGLVLGGAAGAVLAWRVGVALAPDELPALAAGLDPGDTFRGGVRLRAPGVLLFWPIASVVALVALVAGLERPGARGRRLTPDGPPGPSSPP